MKKLCVAVIVLSFFGIGPLKSFFQNTLGVDGKQLVQKVKDQVAASKAPKQTINYLLLDKSQDMVKNAMLLEYDTTKNKLMVGAFSLPHSIVKGDLYQIKNLVSRNYNISINHCLLFQQEGIAKIIDTLAPQGIPLSKEIPGLNVKAKNVSGKEFVAYLEKQSENPQINPYISELFTSLEEEIVKNQSPEKLISIAPIIVNEAAHNITTDLGKGQLMSLGITALMNPVKSIEVIHLKGENPVNLSLDSKQNAQ